MKNQTPGFSCGTHFRKRRANLKRSQTQIGQVAEERNRSTTGGYTVAGSHCIKMWCNAQAVVALSSAEADLYGLVESVGRSHGTHIDVQRPRHAHEWTGTGRCGAQLSPLWPDEGWAN